MSSNKKTLQLVKKAAEPADKDNAQIPAATGRREGLDIGVELVEGFNHLGMVSEHVRGIAPYDAVSSLDKIKLRSQISHFKLDWNESTVDPSPKVFEALQKHLKCTNSLNWYPPLFANELRAKLSHYVGLPMESILVTNGSDDALELLMNTYLDPGDKVVTAYPTYAHALLFARARGANIVKVVYPDVFKADVEAIISAIDERTKLVYLVNPNNPTGTFFHAEEMERILKAAPRALVLSDEAYYEFCGETMVPLIKKYENLLVTRSFSKAFALAALRIGYLMANPNTVRQLTRIYNPKSVNALAQIAAAATLDDIGHYEKYVREVNAAKKIIEDFCGQWGLPFKSTRANYVMIKTPRVARVIKELADEGVHVRDRSSIPELRGYFRFNLGNLQQTDEILRRMDRAFKKAGLTKKNGHKN